ncbi:sulfatase-like hydrolase/transferase [uncultured Cyclobacterium sp.]|uniref:sulfatase-like hydrolase/transferase n=1 Tax=uncultured Cyclobacterium sp. TaxID=453820 RepID=UPI0030EBED57|tara:strand:+ start:432145 stop:434031 length:1887 start_codon:yes stop_codon:yes gene_type:complete
MKSQIKNTGYFALFFGFGLSLLFSFKEPTPEPVKPNILWITTEDISPNLGCYGDEFAKTPFLDQMAKDGVMYTNAIASAPVCAPARSSIATGMHQSSIGSQHMRSKGKFPETFKYYPEYLREAGYFCTNNSKEDYNLIYKASKIWDESGKEAHWRNRKNKDQPFFAVFNFTGTHESATNLKQKHLDVIKAIPKDQLIKSGEVRLPTYFPNTEVVNELWTRYYNNITALDNYVAALVDELKEDGLEDNTIIMFYSDHGAGVPMHKRWLYDTGLKIPLIVYAPEAYRHLVPQSDGGVEDELVSFVDLAPTALNLAGISMPENMQGRAFLGTDLSPARDYVYASRDRMDERYDMQRAVRDKHFKYIRYYEFTKPFVQYMNTPEKGAIMKEIRKAFEEGRLPEAGVKLMAENKPVEELFDLRNDPMELNNLAMDSEYAETLEKMRNAHLSWSSRVGDTGLIPEPILRVWEEVHQQPIYSIWRNNNIPVEEIQETALSNSVALFTNNLSHDNEVVRYWASTGIGTYSDIADPELRSLLISLLADEYPSVQIAAARALCKLGYEEIGLPTLTISLQNDDEWVRLNAALVLDEIGEKSRPVKEKLKEVMTDDNKYVVRVVNHTLNELNGGNNIVE